VSITMILILENNETTRIECLTANGSEKKEKVMGQSLDSRYSEINCSPTGIICLYL